MSWEEFIDRYCNNFEEFYLKYKNYSIDLLYSRDGEKFVYYLYFFKSKKSFFEYFFKKNDIIDYKEYNSPKDLLEDFKIDNKSLKEIWAELEWD